MRNSSGRPGMVARARETKGCFGLGNPVHAEQFGGTTVTSCHVSNDALRIVTPALAELFGGFHFLRHVRNDLLFLLHSCE